jgi:hypothetical protein
MDKVVLGQASLEYFGFPPPIITPPMLRSHLCIYHWHYLILATDIVAKPN